ncbi:MAG: phenylalanine--tRNA ligase subunit beta [Euryarchaeota archaeon]|nr:phenylalanine--tRNA ligase subunit beta [Euryarchaeota archaeon]MDE1836108.1 phenylalanine--tRNA ligase subunit beta [Euryarchaeota archaeon]MDE1879398.1 phenylalanine--tRNA ligase subunit beta [Euryarchaeota archaeon]MDE2044086.1 phenylalanine--tRNA ligase subunit beta [Thermoplasmata archaeon]
MPRSTLSTERLFGLLGQQLSESELRETLFRTKVEIESLKDGLVEVEVNADRLDLLDEGGLALELQGAMGKATGPVLRVDGEALPGVEARVNASVAPLRPELSMAVVEAPPGKALDEGLLEELVRYQELLHATLGRLRQAASIGLYPIEKLRPPFHYAMEPLGQVRFVPLGGTTEVSGEAFYPEHAMAREFGVLGRREDLALTLRDDARTVLSLPPVLNAAGAGEVRPGDRRVLIEATGTRAARTREMVGYMLLPFAARGWSVHPVPVHRPSGMSDGTEVVRPRKVQVQPTLISRLLGSRLSSGEVEDALQKSRLGVERVSGSLLALVPPWRADILAPVDLAEEVAIARGYGSFAPILPPAVTMGRRRPERRYESRLAEVLLGMGYQELHTPVLLSQSSVERVCAPGEALFLRNPISSELTHLRPVLRASLLDALGRNTGSGYPQKIFEIGPVIVRDPEGETGTRTETHLALADAGEGAGFALAAGVAERLFEVLGFNSPREPAEASGTVPGRVAKLRIAGERVALAGEVHPGVLADLHVPMPVSWVEVELTRLEQLRGVLPTPGA